MTIANPQVLIVGAGPTGLSLAVDLTKRGVACRIIDKISTRSDKSRALVLHPRSMELLQLLGVANGFKDAQRGTAAEMYVVGRNAGRVNLTDTGQLTTRYPYLTFVSQEVTERVLEARLNALGVHVEYDVELAGLQQSDDEVQATLRVKGGLEEVRTDYLVGCDGAHSKVRHELELTFEGAPYEQTFLLADVHIDWDLPYDKLILFFGRRGICVMFPWQGDKVSRLVVMRPPEKNQTNADVTLEEIQRHVDYYMKRPVKLSSPVWLSRFRLHHRGVGAYFQGRAFVAGDAAHIHSPAGGQGMNTGIQDALNLGWKLAWILNNKLPPDAAHILISSYHAERHPVGQKLLQTTDQFFRAGATGNLAVATARNLVVPVLLKFAERSSAIRARIFRFISQLGIRYRKSPLNLTPWVGGVKHPQAGNRAPDMDLGLNHWLYDDFAHGGMTWLGIATTPDGEQALKQVLSGLKHPCGAWPKKFVTGSAVAERYGVKDHALLLIRPDAHIALRLDGKRATAADLSAAVSKASWL